VSLDRTTDRFAARTRHHAEFSADDLAGEKRARRLTTSVVIPARNEAATVGEVAGTLRRTLLDQIGLLDEVLVVDADSQDATAEEARAAGARVVRQSDVLPAAGTALGKGEALWKGLAASEGDLVVFVDADIRDIGPRFVVGLLGPLLLDDGVRFTKATYDRPIEVAGQMHASGGGRVTELLARPVIAAFWPELAWLAQPLSGEYGGDRELLESLPFVQGYGVELALLVDILERHGPDVIAQIDLGRRVHENQPLDALGRMASEILHVAIDRLSRQGRLVLTDPLATTLLQPLREATGELAMSAREIGSEERPALRRWLEDRLEDR
jgi:glucosyl-3-phosphoglycerate synthase